MVRVGIRDAEKGALTNIAGASPTPEMIRFYITIVPGGCGKTSASVVSYLKRAGLAWEWNVNCSNKVAISEHHGPCVWRLNMESSRPRLTWFIHREEIRNSLFLFNAQVLVGQRCISHPFSVVVIDHCTQSAVGCSNFESHRQSF